MQNKIRTLIDRLKENHKIVTIALSVIIIALSTINVILNVYFNRQVPNLEVGKFPFVATHVYEFTREDIIPLNETVHQINMSAAKEYVTANITYLIYNSGKGSAYDVNVKLIGEPNDVCEVLSASVFVGEPIRSNFLATAHDEYRIGLLGAGKGYTISFRVKFPFNMERSQKFVLTVTSENAGTFVIDIIIE